MIESHYIIKEKRVSFLDRIDIIDEEIDYNTKTLPIQKRIDFHEKIISRVYYFETSIGIIDTNNIIKEKLDNIEMTLYGNINDKSIYERIKSINI